jgi:hypothetical protein
MFSWDKVANNVIGLGRDLTKKFKTAAEKEQALRDYELKIQALITDGNNQQAEINKIEAEQVGFYTKWRPASGWSALMIVVYSVVLREVFNWAIDVGGIIAGNIKIETLYNICSQIPDLPVIAFDDKSLMVNLLLGLAGLRAIKQGTQSWERTKLGKEDESDKN